jgi:phage/plasmid-like protein (TIGR03299 family)
MVRQVATQPRPNQRPWLILAPFGKYPPRRGQEASATTVLLLDARRRSVASTEKRVMSHEVEALLYTRETPWHRIGQRITEEHSNDIEWLKAQPAIAWTAEKRPLFLGDGREAITQAVVRSSDGRVLGEVGRDYTVVQNAEALDWFAPFVESGDASVECVGSLREGSRVFVLARLNRDPMSVVPGDEVCPYLLLANAHDGSLRLHVGFSAVRVVCANTLQMARTGSRSKLLQLRHTSGIKVALATVQQTIDVAHRQFAASVEQYQRLAQTGCNDETLRKFVNLVFRADAPGLDDEFAAEAEETRSRIFPKVLRLFEEGMGTKIPGVRGTLWGAVNATSEYVQYERGTDEGRRLSETWFGTGANLNRRALDVAIQMAA